MKIYQKMFGCLVIWLFGKSTGTVFYRSNENIWSIVVKDKNNNGKLYLKTIPFDEKFKESTQIQYSLSYQFGLTKNLIRILDDKIIEVKIKDDYTMKTDFNFIDDIQKYPVFLTKNGFNINSEYYVGIYKDKKFQC